jgi:hypothetical protein
MEKLAGFLYQHLLLPHGAGMLQSLLFNLGSTSLWSLMTIAVMLAGGGGLMFKSLRAFKGKRGSAGEWSWITQYRNSMKLEKIWSG